MKVTGEVQEALAVLQEKLGNDGLLAAVRLIEASDRELEEGLRRVEDGQRRLEEKIESVRNWSLGLLLLSILGLLVKLLIPGA